MPIHQGKDNTGTYMQWGNRGAKYYYKTNCTICKNNAIKKAGKQAKAAYSNGYHGS